MGKEIITEIQINATPEKVWQILTGFERYTGWNPFIVSLTGNVEKGSRIKVELRPPGKKGMVFTPQVLVFEKNTEFRWLGKLFLAGIFDGEHIFRLVDNGNGTTTFIQQEKFRGIFVPFLTKMLDKNTRVGFEAMNLALKEQAEKQTELL